VSIDVPAESVGTVTYKNAELEAENSKLSEMQQRSYEHLMLCVRTKC